MPPVELEVVTPILGSFDHCPHCQLFIDGAGVGGQVHQSDLDSYPADMKAEFRAVSDLIFDFGERYGQNLVIRVTDPGSLRGMWTAIRRRIRRYPTFIIGKSECIVGLDPEKVEAAVRARLSMSGSEGAQAT